jgi:leukotriene-A4 hydrolase
LKELDQAFALSTTGNNEVAFRFYRAAINAGYRDIRAPLKAFLLNVGRQRMVLPLYAGLRKQADDRAWAEALYKEARPRYHPATQKSVDKKMAGK